MSASPGLGFELSLVAHLKEGLSVGDYSGRCCGIREKEYVPYVPDPVSQDNVNDVYWDPPLEGLLI